MAIGAKKVRMGDLLVNSGVITEEQLQRALEVKGPNRRLGEVLVDEGMASEEAIAKALSDQLGYDIVDLQNVVIPEEIISLVPGNILERYKVMPFE